MEYPLLWKGRLWRVTVSGEVDVSERWIYVQAFVVSGGSHTAAMQAVLKERYPGIGWSADAGAPMSFGLASLASLSNGSSLSSSVDKSYTNGSSLSSSVDKSYTNGFSLSSSVDKSYPVSSSNSRSHKSRPPSSARPVKDAVSGTGGRRTPAPPRATSTASRPRAPGLAAVQKLKPKQPAIPRMVGWMGSSSTTS